MGSVAFYQSQRERNITKNRKWKLQLQWENKRIILTNLAMRIHHQMRERYGTEKKKTTHTHLRNLLWRKKKRKNARETNYDDNNVCKNNKKSREKKLLWKWNKMMMKLEQKTKAWGKKTAAVTAVNANELWQRRNDEVEIKASTPSTCKSSQVDEEHNKY